MVLSLQMGYFPRKNHEDMGGRVDISDFLHAACVLKTSSAIKLSAKATDTDGAQSTVTWNLRDLQDAFNSLQDN